MRSFVKFGIKTSGAMFIVCEILFLVDLCLIAIVPFADLTIWTWIGTICFGDIVYLFKLDISWNAYRVDFGIAAELKMIGKDEFEVTKLINGKYFKIGEIVKIDDRNWRSKFRSTNLWKKLEDGVESWNAGIRNAEDRLTSTYETRKKRLIERLIQV